MLGGRLVAMAGHYSTRHFFRRAPNRLLTEYFGESELCALLVDRGETDVEELYEAWLLLEDGQRQSAETDFRDIHQLATEPGIAVVIRLAEWEDVELIEPLAEMDDAYDQAFWLFLHQPTLFSSALRLLETDQLPGRSWKKRAGLPSLPARSDNKALERLRDGIVERYRRLEGRGHNCQVEPLAVGDKQYYFVFAEDHSRAEQDFENGFLQRRAHRPAFEIVFLFDSSAGTLDTFAPGGATAIRDLQRIFASAVLGIALAGTDKDERVYELAPLADPSFRFVFEAEARIADVSVRKLRLSLLHARGHRITIEAPTRQELYDRYSRTAGAWGGSDKASITQAEIRVTFAEDGGRRPKARTFSLTYPNSCSLGQDDRDGQLREMLMASGLDPSGLGRDARRR
jgi:hypothetical protein